MRTVRIPPASRALIGVVVFACMPLAAQQGGSGYIKTTVYPGRAGVFLDGKYIGPGSNFAVPRIYSVDAGEHEIRFVEPRYEEAVVKVNVQAGKTVKVGQKLKPLPAANPPFGLLRVVNPDKFAAVYINGKYYGHADEFNASGQGMKLNPGEYDIRVEPLSGGVKSQKIKIEANKTTVVR